MASDRLLSRLTIAVCTSCEQLVSQWNNASNNQCDYERVLLLPRGLLSNDAKTASAPRKKRTKDPLLHPKIPGFPRDLYVDRLFASTKRPTRTERYDNFIPYRKIWKNNERDVEIPLYLTALCMSSINRGILHVSHMYFRHHVFLFLEYLCTKCITCIILYKISITNIRTISFLDRKM